VVRGEQSRDDLREFVRGLEPVKDETNCFDLGESIHSGHDLTFRVA